MHVAPRFEKVDALIRQALLDGAFTAACLLVGRGETVLYRQAYGRLGMEDDTPPTNGQTLFDLASVTKPLSVGTLTLRAIEQGKLCLWDTLGTFLDAPADKQSITVGQILTHTAGFPTGIHLWKQASSPADAARVILQTPLISPPGQDVHYCCAGYILLGQLLECLYDTDLATLCLREIFTPLRMAHTGFNPQSGNIAATEMEDDGRCLQGVVHDENARFLGGVSGNAGLFGTMDDLALYLQMLSKEGKLPDGSPYLSKAAVTAALQSRTPGMRQQRSLLFCLPKYEDGYTGDLFPHETVGHTGFTGTSITLDPTTGLYVVFLTNRICPSRESQGIYRIRRLLHNAVYAAAEG